MGARNPALLLRYLEAYALHSAGIVEAKTIYEAAGVDKRTATAYETCWRTSSLSKHCLPGEPTD